VQRVLITGSDTPIGASVVAAMAARPDVERIYTLAADAGAPARADKQFVLAGDVHAPHLGLGHAGFADLGLAIDTVVHCAERSVVDQDLVAARAGNITPLVPLLQLLADRPQIRLAHLSTVLVAGDKRGLLTEFDLEVGQRFHNAYERSKFEAEKFIRDSAVASRVTVFRRSHTLDESYDRPRTLLATLLRGLAAPGSLLVTGDPHMSLDLVPTGHVGAAMTCLIDQPAAHGKILHLVAGPDRAWSLGQLLAEARRRLGRGAPRFLPPAFARLAPLIELLTLGRVTTCPGRQVDLAPYLRHRAAFNDDQARVLLARHGVPAPDRERTLADLLGGLAS
jgi:nucleoside-diphosphate-sugar epimerase